MDILIIIIGGVLLLLGGAFFLAQMLSAPRRLDAINAMISAGKYAEADDALKKVIEKDNNNSLTHF